MAGYFDEKGRPRIRLRVGGRKLVGTIDALFDTGCSGYLALPVSAAIPLGIELAGVQPVQYADGRIVNELVFWVLIEIDGEKRIIPATLTWGNEALAGISLFRDYFVKIDFKNKKIEITKAK